MVLNIRFAKEEDLTEILNIYIPYILNTAVTFEYEIPSIVEFTSRFRNITNHFPWLVCETDGQIVGYAYAERPFKRAAYQWVADIAVYVHKQYQRKGIARKFYNCIEELLRVQGYYHIYACITKSNKASVEFHRSLGYDEIGFFPKSGFKLKKWHDVVWYDKKLKDYNLNPATPISIHNINCDIVKKITDNHQNIC